MEGIIPEGFFDFLFKPARSNAYGVLVGELQNIATYFREHGGPYFSELPLEIVVYLLENFCTVRSLCIVADTSMAFRKLIHLERILHKVAIINIYYEYFFGQKYVYMIFALSNFF